ncbi:endonuclease/exonuclease/phosphatase family protein [Mycobacterium sp. Y57]|uniref:endonuclease/exonuclease/phosphatase family protein n=1 Tax=Mycolicibacterium xanthum TaxID=2796469 RepID=UPI001C86077B|nr:endonuclease/exonuclease/phosphatase family protein [Mycolicibacterium xanthum]MBX7433102.1 endonuclease/exonuclease/phosphatase family protein [Mycolicibacterium xanthum]
MIARIPEVVSIASLNAHYGLRSDGEPFDVVDACRSLDADVIALQEVWWPDGGGGWIDELHKDGYQLAELRLARAGLSPNPDVCPEPADGTGWWGVAIASRIPLTNPEPIDIGKTPLDAAGRRSALRVGVNTGRAEPISVTAVHATHYFPLAPLHHRRLARLLRGSTRSVVCGDFNLWGPLTGLSFRNWQRPARGRSFPAHRPHSQIDHVLVTSDLQVEHAEVLGDVGSDHRPLRVRVAIGPPSGLVSPDSLLEPILTAGSRRPCICLPTLSDEADGRPTGSTGNDQ